MRKKLIAVTVCVLLLAGCAGLDMGKIMGTTATVATTAPDLAHQFDNVYAYLIKMKAVPDNRDKATAALAAMDAVAPIVQQGATALQGDNFNWASFVLQAALATAKIMGYFAAVP